MPHPKNSKPFLSLSHPKPLGPVWKDLLQVSISRPPSQDALASLPVQKSPKPQSDKKRKLREFWEALKKEDVAQVRKLLKEGVSPDALIRDSGANDFPLNLAFEKNNKALVEILLNYGANVQKANDRNLLLNWVLKHDSVFLLNVLDSHLDLSTEPNAYAPLGVIHKSPKVIEAWIDKNLPMAFGHKSLKSFASIPLWKGWILTIAALPDNAFRQKIVSRFDEIQASADPEVEAKNQDFAVQIAWDELIQNDEPESLCHLIEVGILPDEQFSSQLLILSIFKNSPRCIEFFSSVPSFKKEFKQLFKEDVLFSSYLKNQESSASTDRHILTLLEHFKSITGDICTTNHKGQTILHLLAMGKGLSLPVLNWFSKEAPAIFEIENQFKQRPLDCSRDKDHWETLLVQKGLRKIAKEIGQPNKVPPKSRI